MKVIIREVCSYDWTAIYLNDKKVLEDHNVGIQDICEEIQELIDGNGKNFIYNPIDTIKGEYFYLDDEYAEEYGFPDNFSDIPEDVLV